MSALAGAYSTSFYNRQRAGSSRSARHVLPIVFAAVQPKSVVDVGCGAGTWLRPARSLGAQRAVGIDGDWVKGLCPDPTIEIVHTQLENPIGLDETFDLAICLEVAEHLSPERAAGLVDDLTRLAKHVLFSAAIPGQGGHLHVNEQWQSYWAALFAGHGYGAQDVVRPRVRWRQGVEFWYRQNAILYSRGAPVVPPRSLDMVHPYQRVAWGISAAKAALGADFTARAQTRSRPLRPES